MAENNFFPEVPCRQVLPEGLKNQTLITVRGEPKPNADRFMIDICKGDDIAFHFNPRFNEDGKQVIVRASRINDVWDFEEKELPSFPFRRGKPFEIKILCTSSEYRVEVDDRHLLNYVHRMKELDQITHLHIHHDVVLKHVHIVTVGVENITLGNPLQTTAKNRKIFLKDPYVQILPKGVIDQMLITVHGAPKVDVERFDINICKGHDVAFHFNPRFNESGGQAIVRTTRINGDWGPEERHIPFFPFRRGKPFVIKILCTASGYRVETDSNLVLHYAHRIMDLEKMTHILIEGVDLKYVHVEGYFLRVPYIQVLPEGLKDKTLITIYGAPKEDVDKFAINICKGKHVAFHFNPRFNDHGRQLMVMAALIQNRWCSIVEDDSFFPFTPGKPFELQSQ
ncbi:galectin-6-like [Colossoma macropomum]|uniref:galectin-6-like n=1 Tax=Colossoma macropomum TaxID=42526 RepID=UPI0018646FF2|nr:galectin-6-like [Colossoma macropomum]